MIKLLRKFGFLPRVAVWELTLRCNLSCRHCGSRAGKPRPDELSLAECLSVVEQLSELGCRMVTLGGGEPLLRPEWPIIAEALVDRGIKVGMVTNGLMWTDTVARTAKAVGLDTVAFSLDGFEEAHDFLRHKRGLWQLVQKAVNSATTAGLTVSAVTTVYNGNVDQLEELREHLREIGITRWQIQLGTVTGNMADNRDLALPPEGMLDLVPRIASMCRDGKIPKVYPGHDIGYFGDPEERLRDPKDPVPVWTGCPAGCSIIGIESNGNIKGCLSLPSAANGEDAFVEGNLRESSMRDIWRRKDGFAYNRQFTLDNLGGFCKTCDYAEVCRGGCTWASFSQNRFVRDNEYCYWRQLKQSEARDDSRVKLPIAQA